MKKSTLTISELIGKNTPATQPIEKVKTPEDEKNRLMQVIEKQRQEGGSQEATFKTVFADEKAYSAFAKNVDMFITKKIKKEELPKTRVYVTNDAVCNYRINAIRPNAILLTPSYTIVLEKDQNRADDAEALVLRIILNKDNQGLRLQDFFNELDFQNVSLTTLDDLVAHMDSNGGITVQQMLIGNFLEKYGSRKDGFQFADDCYAIYEGGKLLLTHVRWKKSVSLKMPADGSRPWLYHYVKADDGSRPSADFRVNLYGALWHQPKH